MTFEQDEGKVVYIETSHGNVQGAFITEAEVSQDTKIIGTPGEMGMQILDHKVIMPMVITVSGIVKMESYSILEALWQSIGDNTLKGSLCSVYFDGDNYENMIITRFKKKKTPDHYDAMEITVELSEYLMGNV